MMTVDFCYKVNWQIFEHFAQKYNFDKFCKLIKQNYRATLPLVANYDFMYELYEMSGGID